MQDRRRALTELKRTEAMRTGSLSDAKGTPGGKPFVRTAAGLGLPVLDCEDGAGAAAAAQRRRRAR